VAAVEFWGRCLWSLSGSGLGTTLTASGNSGSWGDTAPATFPSGSIDLGKASDVGLFVHVGTPGGTTPSLTVQLDLYDDLGNIYLQVLKTAAITTAGSAAPVFAGLHGGSASAYLVLPMWGRVSWAITGTTPSFPGTEIALYGR
jgi:hypothetical protein